VPSQSEAGSGKEVARRIKSILASRKISLNQASQRSGDTIWPIVALLPAAQSLLRPLTWTFQPKPVSVVRSQPDLQIPAQGLAGGLWI
jgi:hypothetical protein